MILFMFFEEKYLYRFKWYRKIKGGKYVLAEVHGQKMWFRNHKGFDKKRILKEEIYKR